MSCSRFFLFTISLICFFCLATSSAVRAQQKNAQKVDFYRYSEGVAVNMVRDLLLTENTDYRDILGRPPEHTIGQVDLNKDQTPEIIVRIDDEYNFCDDQGLCDTRVYVYEATGLIEVGRFKSSADILVSDYTTDGINHLLVERPDGQYDLYQWFSDQYKKVTK